MALSIRECMRIRPTQCNEHRTKRRDERAIRKKMKSLRRGRLCFFLPPKTKNKGEGRLMGCGRVRKGIETEIGKGESGNKNLGGEKKRKK